MRILILPRIWRRAIPAAWKQTQLLHPAKISGCVAVSALNLLWPGHGILRSSTVVVRAAVVGLGCYVVIMIAELLWLMRVGPKFTGFESTTAPKAAGQVDSTDALVEELSGLPAADLRDETLQLAKEMKSFEVGTDREFVETLVSALPEAGTEAERDEVLDKQSAELMQHNLRRWRTYRDRFYRPARAFRDELRKRLGIRNVNSEPRIPALDQAILSGAKPIAQAANYLAALARRLK
ncbi:MAG: hypothetical protein DMD30_15885 [Gemmatimonadetes bacterium]|nr:MAG: hypothetical protein DMD30_15885 [Gemmatimonadota bacterium]